MKRLSPMLPIIIILFSVSFSLFLYFVSMPVPYLLNQIHFMVLVVNCAEDAKEEEVEEKEAFHCVFAFRIAYMGTYYYRDVMALSLYRRCVASHSITGVMLYATSEMYVKNFNGGQIGSKSGCLVRQTHHNHAFIKKYLIEFLFKFERKSRIGMNDIAKMTR